MSTTPWLDIATGELGQHEVPGSGNNQRILAYHQACTLRATSDEIPWCSAFVNWCLAQAGYPTTGLANARSWLNYGIELQQPVKGCIVVFSRGANPQAGHVGFVVDELGDYLRVLGGNQSDQVRLALYPKNHVLPGGYRWPEVVA